MSNQSSASSSHAGESPLTWWWALLLSELSNPILSFDTHKRAVSSTPGSTHYPESSGGREGYKAVFTLEKRKLSEISPSLWWRDCTELCGLPFRHHTNPFTKSFHPLRSWWEAVRMRFFILMGQNKFQRTILCFIFCLQENAFITT